MAQYPLLILPLPGRAEREKRHGGRRPLHLPDAGRQAERLTPQFQRLQQAMDRQRIELQDNSIGLEPEKVLVLETVGPVQNFIKAVKKIEGLEWLGELEIDDIEPDSDFRDERDPQKTLKGYLFLVMADQRALQELQNLFNRWQQSPDIKFPYGLAPLKEAFVHLHTIRPWDAEDRIRDTGLLEDWQKRMEHEQEVVPFEAELWLRENPSRREQAEAYLRGVVENLGGEILEQCLIPEIAYHGLLGKIPVEHVPQIVNRRDVRLLQCEDIMFLRPVGQCAVPVPDDLSTTDTFEGGLPDLPSGDPVVALFDGLPLTKHRLLDGRLILDDPDNLESAYQAHERFHGTAMASLITHGDLGEERKPVPRPIYVRPVMKPFRGFDRQFIERIPEEFLPVDVIHRAVRRLYESEGDDPPAAPNIHIINLSICDRARPFDRSMSPLARLLDWLSWKYNALFIVSAGNHLHDIVLNISRANLSGLSADDLRKATIEAIAADTRHRRLLSPAETINGLTVAATHTDASTPINNPNQIDPFNLMGLPSTINAHGPGYRRTIKPEILLPGGRQLLVEKMGSTHANAILQTSSSIRPPGQCVAAPGSSGELDKTIYTRGTSNCTALASRWGALLLDVIDRLRTEAASDLPREYDVVLLKTLLVHGASWGEARTLYESILRNGQNSRTFIDYLGRFLGYGLVNAAKVMFCTDQRVTVLGFGALNDGQADEFFLPLPPSLSAITQRRRLAITLAWLTPINSRKQNYRIGHLWFDPKNQLAPKRTQADHRAVTRGTVQHEVLEGQHALDFQDGDGITIKISCRADAGDIAEPIPYGLAVTLEVAEGVDIRIYEEVRERLRVRVPVATEGR